MAVRSFPSNIFSPKVFSPQVFLMVLTLFSWGLLFLSIALSPQHSFRKVSKSSHEPVTPSGQILKDACDECWSGLARLYGLPSMRPRNESKITPSVLHGTSSSSSSNKFENGWNDADAFYLFSLSSTLTTLKIRLKMANEVAGKRIKDIREIECKVQRLEEKLKLIWGTRNKFSLSKNNQTLTVFHSKTFPSNLSSGKDFASVQSSKTWLKINSLSAVPSPVVSVIVDGRDKNIDLFLKSRMKKIFSNVYFHVGVYSFSHFLRKRNTLKDNIYFHEVPINSSKGAVFNILIRYASTPYTLVVTDPFHLNQYIKLSKLEMYMRNNTGVWAVSGGILTPDNVWQSSCLQSQFKMFRASFYRKTIGWLNGCQVCSALDGPFLALTPVLRILRWNEQLSEATTTLDLFLRAYHHHHYFSASCIDSLFSILKRREALSRKEIVEFALVHRLKEVYIEGTAPVVVSCREMKKECREAGEMVSPCCLSELASMVKFFMATCEAHGLFCELQEGTLLGSVKFGDILPWERDADITFHTANFSAIQDLSPIFAKAGLTLKLNDNRWCCVNGSQAGGEGKLTGELWSVELYSQHAMDSEEMVRGRRLPTKVELHGGWVRAPTNPGMFARNRYGREIYRHSQHWLDLGKLSGWEQYSTDSFSPCGIEGNHACLNLNPTDGATQFQLPCA